MGGKNEAWFEAFDTDFTSHKRVVSAARIASIMGFKAAQSVYNQTDGVQDMSLQQYFAYAKELARFGAAPTALVAWFCRQAGFTCAPLPKRNSGIDAQLPHVLSEFSDLIAAVSAAMADGRVDAEEADRVWAEGEQAISAILGAMHATREAVTTVPLRPQTMAEAHAKENGGAA